MAIAIIASIVGAAVVTNTAYNIIKTEESIGEAKKGAEEAKKAHAEQIRIAEKQMKDQQKEFDKKRTDQAALNATQESNTGRELASTRQRKLAMQGQSYRDTILTGPLGIPNTPANAPNTANKTLLGA